MLNSLFESFKEVKAAIKFGRKSITLDEVISALRSWDMEMSASKTNGGDESLDVRGRQKDKNQNRGRSKTRSKSRNKGDKWWKSVKCFGCQEVGHTRRFCHKKNKRWKDQDESKGEVVIAQDNYDSDDVLVVSTTESKKSWMLDSGCSFHMTPNKDWFESLEEFDGGQVVLVNNKCYEVKGVGTMRIKMHDGIERLLQQVKYITSLKRNLISLGTLDMNGYSYKASGGVMTVVNGSLVIMKGKIDNGLYVLQGSTVIGSVSSV